MVCHVNFSQVNLWDDSCVAIFVSELYRIGLFYRTFNINVWGYWTGLFGVLSIGMALLRGRIDA